MKVLFVQLTHAIHAPPIRIDLKQLSRHVLEPNGIDISKEEYDTMEGLVKAINSTDDWHAEFREINANLLLSNFF